MIVLKLIKYKVYVYVCLNVYVIYMYYIYWILKFLLKRIFIKNGFLKWLKCICRFIN